MSEYIRAQQENLNAAGHTDMNGDELVVDGIYGPKTQSAELARDKAAKGNGIADDHRHKYDGTTGPMVPA